MSPRTAHTGLKAALASAAAVALLSTGAAFAASGHAPWARTPAAATAATSDHAMPSHPVLPSHSVPTDDPSEGAGDTGDGPDAHALWGLCTAYQAGAKADHGAALSSPAFVALAQAAGGADHVADFCATLPKPGSDRAHPTHPAHPSDGATPTRPTQAASPTHPASPSHPAPTHPSSPDHPDSSSHPVSSSHPTAPASHPSAHTHP
jgi:hypothetical protein